MSLDKVGKFKTFPGARRMERRGRGKRTLRPSGKASSVAGFKNCSSDMTKWSWWVLSAHRYRGKGKRQECHSEVTRTTPEYWSCTLVTLHWSYRSASGRSSGSYDSREWRFCRQNRMREVRESLVLERWGELAVVRRMRRCSKEETSAGDESWTSCVTCTFCHYFYFTPPPPRWNKEAFQTAWTLFSWLNAWFQWPLSLCEIGFSTSWESGICDRKVTQHCFGKPVCPNRLDKSVRAWSYGHMWKVAERTLITKRRQTH